MPFDPKKRDARWTMFQPGCWLDPAGHAHIFPDEVIAEMQRQHPEIGFEFTQADYDLVVDAFTQMLRRTGRTGEIQFIKHERGDAA